MEKEIREEIATYCKLAYEQGFVPGASGNLSGRLDEHLILITPSCSHKGMLKAADLLLFDIGSGKVIQKDMNEPSSEIRMHAHVYLQRPDVQAVIHAHPPYAVALSVIGMSLQEVVLPEAVLALGTIVDCGYATPTTEDVVRVMKQPVKEGVNALMLARHGSVTMGESIHEAFGRLETLEHVARVTAIAGSLCKIASLPQKEIKKLQKLSPYQARAI